MMRGGAGVTLMPRSQQGHAYLTRWCWMTRSCSRKHVELLAGFNSDLYKRVTVVGAEAIGFGQFVPHDIARQVGTERLTVAALLARVCANRRFRCVFLRGRGVRTERFGFVEQAELIRIPRFAPCTEQLAAVSP
ncbi:hypothetical protein OKW39_003619 [Paraburkholderia sp. MM6662-R1]